MSLAVEECRPSRVVATRTRYTPYLESMSTTPNLFAFATSELSQDAFLAWLVACSRRTDRSDLARAGKNFISWLWSQHRPSAPEPANIVLLEDPHLQDEDLDLWFLAQLGENKVVFVIEDKTHTTHHSSQPTRYKELGLARQAKTNSSELVLVYLKTGYHFEHDQDIRTAGWTPIRLEDFVAFLERQDVASEIFGDYRAWAKQLLDERTSVLKQLWTAQLRTADGRHVLEHDYAQYEFVKALAAKCTPDIGKLEIKLGRNIGGHPWAHLHFASMKDVYGPGIHEGLFHRVDRRKDGYYVATRQHAFLPPDSAEARGKKLERLRKYQAHFIAAWSASGAKVAPGRLSGDHRGADESEIGVVFFDEEKATIPLVLERIALVHASFVARIAEDASLIVAAPAAH
jgi:hypothetical protein